jgi:Tol biopolymer transport system component/DNA-binding winged helix-turn-helix (wHTH) protein
MGVFMAEKLGDRPICHNDGGLTRRLHLPHMSASPSPSVRIRFACFEVDLQSQELFRDGVPVRLPNQSFLALAALIERPGALVTREELRARLWPDKRVVEFEQGLNAVINRLREALGDNADDPVYIETLPRRGYRFMAALARPADVAQPPPASAEAPAAPRPRLNRFVRPGAAVLLMAVLVGAFLALRRPTPPPTAPRSAALTVMPLTSLLGQEHMPALSPDGTHVLFAWEAEAGKGFDLYLRPLDSERLTRLTRSPAVATAGAWSPDGGRIAVARSGGGLFLMDATGGGERRLVGGSFTQESLMQPSWAPDGHTLAYSVVESRGRHVVRLLDLGSLAEHSLAAPSECWHAGAPAFSPDGRQLAFVCTRSMAVYEVYVVERSAGAAPRKLAHFSGLPQGLAWRDAQHLLVANDSGDGTGLWTVAMDGRRDLRQAAEDSLAPGLAVAAGRLVYSRARQVIDIWHLPLRDPGPARRWIYSTRQQLTPSYSPDGARIAFQSNRSGSPEIWIADANGANAARLTSFNGPLAGGPSWCSDGRRLAFDSRESGMSAIYIVDTLERVPRRVASSRDNLALPVWSSDCRFLIASDGREGLYRVPAEGGQAEKFSAQRSYQAAVAGERVVFNAAGPDGVTLWSKPITGGKELPLPGLPALGYSDSWTTDGRWLYFTDTTRRPVEVRRYSLADARLETVGSLPNIPTPLGGLGMAVSPDGESLLYTHTEDTQGDLVIATPQQPD